MFKLHPQLEKDGIFLGDLSLCRVLLMNNKHFPWVVLVPRLPEIKDLTDMTALDRALLMEETSSVMSQMQMFLKPDKMNMAALGNKTPQFHMHVIARFTTDTAWPNPIWGGLNEPYAEEKMERILYDWKRALYLLQN